MKKSVFPVVLLAAVISAHGLYADQGTSVEFLNSGQILPNNLPFSEAVRHGNTLYLSGQIGVLPGTMKLAPGGIKEEAQQTMENIKISSEAHGYTLANLVKCTVMLANMSE
jgi:enamine deaminase RidA (YjgF/YER057c/UK114 family)